MKWGRGGVAQDYDPGLESKAFQELMTTMATMDLTQIIDNHPTSKNVSAEKQLKER